MRTEIKELHQRLKTTTVYVTHDQIEAMTMADRIVVMHDGVIEQIGTPLELYDSPANLFVAGFIGSPAMNLVEAEIDGDELLLGQFRIPLAAQRRPGRTTSSLIVGIRPETFEDSAFSTPGLPTIDADVVVLEELGSDAHVFFRVDATRVAAGLDEDADEAADLVSERGALLNARVDARTSARVGSTIRLAVDPSRFHFFDAETGASLLESVASLQSSAAYAS